MELSQLYYVLRILLAGICGILIGLERKNRSKGAGVRTHCVVACGAALMMIISKYCFADLPIDALGLKGADPSRIASQVVNGIGFLGAGMIFVHKSTITGLTTAAGIWATAGVGMAIGAGMYTVGIAAAIIIILAQIILHFDFHKGREVTTKKLIIKHVTEQGYQRNMMNMLAQQNVTVHDVLVEKSVEEGNNYIFSVELPPEVMEDSIISMIEYDCSITS